jgi:hypothetical protein
MAQFETPLLLRPLGGRLWHIEHPFVYVSDIAGRIEVPAGFISDLNSIPRFLWWASTPADYPEAGVVHDWGYRGNLPRAVADAVYREILGVTQMGAPRRNGRFWALRIFGRFSYKK